MRKTIALGAAALVGAATAAVLVPAPANAATTGNTVITYTITPGALALTAPADVTASSDGTLVSASIPVHVSDARNQALNLWTTTANMTDFVDQADGNNKALATGFIYLVPGGFSSTGVVPVLGGAGLNNPLGGIVPVATKLSAPLLSPANSETDWTGVISGPAALFTKSGVYKATVTHSVA